jgi:ubiquinone/menaquinone biosynthesis C-methylase UbiE
MHHHKTAHADAPKTSGSVIRWARYYDLVSTVVSLGRDKAIRRKLLALAAPKSGEKLLDVGCGTGTFAIAAKARVPDLDVHGIDASPEMIEVAGEKAHKAAKEIDLRVALIEDLPFPNASFDIVTSSLMLHHLPDDLKRRGIAEIRRVLKPGGRFLALDIAAEGHSPIGHLLAIVGIGHGESMEAKLVPMLREADFSQAERVPTRFKSMAFIRAS